MKKKRCIFVFVMKNNTIVSVFEVPSFLSDMEVGAALRKLPKWRKSKALKYKFDRDKFLCAEAYILLRNAMMGEFGVNPDEGFEYEPAGKPYLAGHRDVHFNISHCCCCVCCAVSKEPVGIDVESIQYARDFAEVVCSDAEMARIEAARNPDVEFTKIWTMKESLLKCTGEGVRNDMKTVLDGYDESQFDIRINENAGYVLCVACNLGKK